MSIWLSNEKVSKRKPIVLYFCSHRLCANRMYMKRAFGRVSIRKEVKSFSNYRPAKLSVRDVCLLQTHRDSPSTFRESSVSFTNTFRAPLGKEKAPLVFPLEWNKSLVSITCPLLSFSLSNSNKITYRGDVFNEHRRHQSNCRWMRKQATFAGRAASATHRRKLQL